MAVRLGEAMVQLGLLSEEQVETILEEQRRDHRPFGDLAERLFGVDPAAVDRAWAEQYASIAHSVDPRQERYDREALQLVSARQAWQFRVLPIRRDGGEIMVATTKRDLPRALRFAMRRFALPVYFVIAEAEALGEALEDRFPFAGMSAEDLRSEAA
ncbi:MAG: hypothetical protein D6824_02835 [Planctomycetota bacterium]|nr:MAG: hypothetical protein D6824_02835 [Planctomycetota bacterium]